MTTPDPLTAVLDHIAALRESLAEMQRDLLRGDRAIALLEIIVPDVMDGGYPDNTLRAASAFLAEQERK